MHSHRNYFCTIQHLIKNSRMERRRRPFYIIGHNPNTIEEAEEFLAKGANGLEPDIVFAHDQFYVSHTPHLSYAGVPTLASYLEGLKQLLLSPSYNLALLIFDLKDTDFDINRFFEVVRQNFSGGPCDGVTILMTHSDDQAFLCRFTGGWDHVGIGVDESNTTPAELEKNFLASGNKNFTYADGITSFLNKPGVYSNVQDAQHCRDLRPDESFKLIYTWVLSLEGSMRKYLNTYIDGIMVDAGSVKNLKKLIEEDPYSEAFELAINGYNPFQATPLPRYKLLIKTSAKQLAGTDARILFTLKNESGQALRSLPYNGNLWGALERDSCTEVMLEGMDLGPLHSLTVEALSADLNSDWLPESITVESSLLPQAQKFIFNNDSLPEVWIRKKDGPVTRFAT